MTLGPTAPFHRDICLYLVTQEAGDRVRAHATVDRIPNSTNHVPSPLRGELLSSASHEERKVSEAVKVYLYVVIGELFPAAASVIEVRYYRNDRFSCSGGSELSEPDPDDGDPFCHSRVDAFRCRHHPKRPREFAGDRSSRFPRCFLPDKLIYKPILHTLLADLSDAGVGPSRR